MCHFLTVGVSERGASTLEALGRERDGLGVVRCSNLSIAALFPPGDALFFLTHGQCSCDLVVQPEHRGVEEEKRHHSTYRKKGWSEAKIERALAASRISRERSAPGEPVLKLMAALERQVELCGSVRVHAHEYRGAIQQEPVPSSPRTRMSMEALRAARGAFPTDVVVDLVRQ
jgi:hypothetical protein